MKKLLIAVMVMVSPMVMAVTLPSSSYTPYSSGGETSYEGLLGSGVKLPSSSFVQLGEGDGWCRTETPGTESCENCCIQSYSDCRSSGGTKAECDSANLECERYCDGGSVPLDGGLSILLLLSLAGGAAKLLRNRDKE